MQSYIFYLESAVNASLPTSCSSSTRRESLTIGTVTMAACVLLYVNTFGRKLTSIVTQETVTGCRYLQLSQISCAEMQGFLE